MGSYEGRRKPIAISDRSPDRPQNRITRDGQVLLLNGEPLDVSCGRRGVKVGCHFITYEAWELLVVKIAEAE